VRREDFPVPIAFALLSILTACAAADPPAEMGLRRFEYAGTEMAAPVKVVLYATGENAAGRAAEAAFARIRELNSAFSDFDPQSELRRLCRAASGGEDVPVSADLWRILARAEEISRASRGSFDITVGPVVRLWRRARRLHSLPSPDLLREARDLVDFRLVRLDPARRSVRMLRPGLWLDLGGIAKGDAAGEALAALGRHGVDRAMVAIGGDIVLGLPPPGMPGWRIAIAPEGPADHLWLSRAAVSTSGDTEQFVVIDGKRYSHIVDPRTGLGLSDQALVTIVAPDGATADALATAVSVLGPEEGSSLIEGTPGAAGRIVRGPQGKKEVFETMRWKDLAPAFLASFAGASSPPGRADEPREDAPPPSAPARKAGEKGAGEAGKAFDPTTTPTVAWILDPSPSPDAGARTEADMKPYTERIPGSGVKFDMVPIRGGKFLLGSPPGEANRSESEGPQREVEIDPFWMERCETTWDEYELWGLGYDAVREKPSEPEAVARDRLADAITRPTKPYADPSYGMGREGFPAICMSHLAAKVYCKWLSAKTGRYYRLPTEAEWEYACRAGTATAYSFGNDPKDLRDHAWFFATSEEKYHKVGQKKPNPWGLHDMHGNVAEWVLDRFTPEGYGPPAGSPLRNPLVELAEIHPRAVRGGSWMDDPDMLRSAARRGSSKDWNRGDPQMPKSIWYLTDGTFIGFRVVRPFRVPDAKEAVRYDLDPVEKKALADYLEYLGARR
jgi:thiamine biosynthesis lipoprotein ApbE/formylglycine-generating enzyme required for sulfatase activity